MIPSKNDINCSQKIKIQLTSDNKCIIKSTLESAEKSKGTINKSEYSINIPDLKDINDNELLTLSKSLTNNQINENEANSNLLISFSNISELNKTGDKDQSLIIGTGIGDNSQKKIFLENKENININNKQSFDSFNNYNNNNMSDANDLVNINFNDKSKCSDLSNKNNSISNRNNNSINKRKKKKENSNNVNFK